jgi:hypothetical protein
MIASRRGGLQIVYASKTHPDKPGRADYSRPRSAARQNQNRLFVNYGMESVDDDRLSTFDNAPTADEASDVA